MLEVGTNKQTLNACGADGKQPCPPLSLTESRTHMAAWSIVSAPLVLSMDLTDKALMDQYWPIISNVRRSPTLQL